MARLSEIGPGTVIVKRHPDGSFDATVKLVAKAHELPVEIATAAEKILNWTGSASVIVIGSKNRLDRLEWPRRL